MKAFDDLTLRALCALLTFAAGATRAQPGDVAPQSVEPPAAILQQTEDSSRNSLRSVRDAFVAAGDFEAALRPAEAIVETLESGAGPQLAVELGQLARIQAELDDFTAAELNYLKAIELLQNAEGEFSISLLEPYQGLGRSYMKNRQFPEAVTALEQAQHVSQRNLGLFNVTQTELIDDLTTAHLGLGDTATAQELQLERLENAIRRFGPDSRDVIPFRYALASYYDQSRMREAAREQYQHVLASLEARPESAAEALDPLRRLMTIELVLGDGDEARTKLVALLETVDADPLERARSLAALGDWAMAKEDPAGARGYYLAAHEQLREASDTARDEILAGPVMLDFIAPLSSVDRGARRRAYAWGTIVLEFDVSADGRASNVEVVSADPPSAIDAAYGRRVREAHFRPRLVAGLPQVTHDVRFTHYFRYYVND